jgi:tetratricopeptide (TPR) repeat protein
MSMRTAVVVLAVSSTVACAGNGERARRYVANGDEYVSAGRYEAAAIEYRNAIKRDAGSAETHRKLGDAYNALGKANDAYRAYSRAIDFDPADVQSCLGAGRLLLGAGLYDAAQLRAFQALDHDPHNVDAMLLAARALTALKRFDEAAGAAQTAIAANGGPSAFVVLGQVKRAAHDDRGAEAAFRQAVQQHASSIEARVALADFLVATNRSPEAETQIKTAVSTNPTSELANRALASFYVGAGRAADAEPYLETAAAQPKQTLQSTIALADFYLRAHRRDEARVVLSRVEGPEKVAAKVRLAAIDYEMGSHDAAQKAVDKILQKTPSGEAWALKARLLAAEHKTDEALRAAQAAVDLDRNEASAYYLIGTIELDRRRFHEAEVAFRQVLQLNRMVPEARLQLARATLAAGRPGEAIALATAAGSDLPARITLARALIADRQIARARAELMRLENGPERSSEPGILLGSLDLDDGNVSGARAHASGALAIAPDSIDALLLSAHAALAADDGAAAEQYLTRAVARDRTSFDANATLARIYMTRGDANRARTTLEALVKNVPDSAEARTALGLALQQAGRVGEAKHEYELALTLDSSQAIAANNLARVYAADPTRQDEAIRLARIATAEMPDEAEAHDTLGWAYYKSGQMRPAVHALERAIALAPASAPYKAHLAEVRHAIAEQERVAAAEQASLAVKP